MTRIVIQRKVNSNGGNSNNNNQNNNNNNNVNNNNVNNNNQYNNNNNNNVNNFNQINNNVGGGTSTTSTTSTSTTTTSSMSGVERGNKNKNNYNPPFNPTLNYNPTQPFVHNNINNNNNQNQIKTTSSSTSPSTKKKSSSSNHLNKATQNNNFNASGSSSSSSSGLVHSSSHSDEENNSSDEYEPSSTPSTSLLKSKSSSSNNINNNNINNINNPNMIQDERLFEDLIKKKRGLVLRRMKEDGNCLFRSIADQIYGDQEMHNLIREKCMDYMMVERDHYSQFITEDFDEYITRKRNDRVYGNNAEMQAMSELFNRPIEVYHKSLEPINIFHGGYKGNSPLRLSYRNGNHYDSLTDINNPAVGLGLGFADFHPGAADKGMIEKAMKSSDVELLERQLLEDSIFTSDWRETENEIEEQILAASRAEFYESLLKDINNNNKS